MKKLFLAFALPFFAFVSSLYAQQAVTSFTLINADTDVPIRTLVNGDVLNYSTLPTRNLNIRANTNPVTVGSVVFLLDGNRKAENHGPYSYAGEVISGTHVNYNKITPALAVGQHSLTATPYTATNGTGTAGGAHTVSFTVTENGSTNTPPTVSAGPDKSLTLPANSTTLSGSASDPGGSIASLLWTKQSGPSATMTNTGSATLSLSNLVAGTYVFRLTAHDNGGASAFDEATVTVTSSTTGITVTTFTLVNADNEQDIRTLVNGDVLNYGTLPTANLNIRANTNPATVGSVVFRLNGVAKNENGKPYTLAGETISSNGTVNYNKITPALAAGTHTLAATAYGSSNGTGTVGGTHTVTFSVTGNGTTNTPPTANAGPDKTLTLPANSTTLSGSGSDAGGSIASYLWTKQTTLAGTMTNTTSPTLTLSNLAQGTHVFRLTVTDNQGATGYDEAIVIVNPAGGTGGACAVYNEVNGLVVIEIESHPVAGDWSVRTAVAGYTGASYYEWRHGNTNTSAAGSGLGVLTYTVRINNPGRYRFQMRSAAPERTDFNDVWVKFPQGNAYGIRSGSTLNLNTSWFKVYHNVSNNAWTWNSKTKDHDPHDIFVDFNTPGTYTIQFSGRSNQFKIDRFVLYNTSVTTATANSTGNPQSSCASNKMELEEETASTQEFEVYPNPSSGNVTVAMSAEKAGRSSIRLYDVSGKLVETLFDGELQEGEMKRVDFDGGKLAKGIYLVRLVTADKILIKRLVLQ